MDGAYRMTKVSKLTLINDIQALGVKNGDTVLVRAALSKIGTRSRSEILDALIESVGVSGTIVVLGFTKAFKFRNSKSFRDYIFDSKFTKPNVGALSNVVFSHTGAKRSRHPTNSFIALGAKAESIICDHSESSLCYSPIGKLIEADAKMILIGCTEDSPGFTTVHYNQELLGITKRSWFAGMYKCQHRKTDGSVGVFVRNDFGGCSAGFGKFYDDYRAAGILREGSVGQARAYCIDAQSAFKVENEILTKNKKYFLCENPECISCRVGWKFNKTDIFKFLLTKIKRALRL
jgi:aminoglycoside 3-N-acetyltransferase